MGASDRVGARLKEVRLQKGISGRALAARAGISPAYLSRLEGGRMSPTISTLARITDALGESIVTIFEEGDSVGPVVREADRQSVASKGAVDYLLSPSRNGRLEVIAMTVEPGASSGAPYTHWGEEECVVVLEGVIEMVLRGTSYTLEVGDAITFACREPHGWRNPSKSPTQLLWIITPGGGTAT